MSGTRVKAGAAAIVAALGLAVAPATPVSAGGTDGPLCTLNSNAWQYNYPLGQYERTVHAGYRYRVHGYGYDSYGRLWYYGHSGESYWDDGWVLAYHVSC